VERDVDAMDGYDSSELDTLIREMGCLGLSCESNFSSGVIKFRKPITESDLTDLYLILRVRGVLYHRDDDGKAAATVLLELTFVEMGVYACPANSLTTI
jgi:hypothetical protein